MKISKIEENVENKLNESESDSDWVSQSHRVLSADKLLTNSSKDIEQLLLAISKKYKVSVKDAAFALTNVFQKMSN